MNKEKHFSETYNSIDKLKTLNDNRYREKSEYS